MNRKIVFSLLAFFAIHFHFSIHAADPPGILNHQGRIAVNDVNFDGTGHFKFSFVKDAGLGTEAVLWHHDATATTASEPASAAAITITKGHYAVLLGESNPIGPTVFADNSHVSLRIWFSTDGTTFEQLSPDRRIASAAYALSAGSVSMVSDDSVTSNKLSDGAITFSKLAPTYQSGATGQASLALDLVSNPGTSSFTATYDQAFASAPDLMVPEGWTITSADETGFTATSSGAFAPQTVDAMGDVGGYLSAALVDNCVAVAYSDQDSGTLKYAIASDAYGNGPWKIITIDASGSITSPFCSLAVVDGVPAVAYFNDAHGLHFACASDPRGTAGSWSMATVDDFGGGGFIEAQLSLAVVDGNPAIAYTDFGASGVWFARSSDTKGTAGTWTSTLVLDESFPVGFGATSLAVVEGTPSIVCKRSDLAGPDSILYVRAANAQGDGPWQSHVVETSVDIYVGGAYTSFAVVGGSPAVTYHALGELRYARADSGSPSGTSDWTVITVETDGVDGNTGSYSSLAVTNGSPAASYRNDDDELRFAIASEPTGTAGPWHAMTLDANPGFKTDLLGGPIPGIAYEASEPDDLRFVSLAPSWTAWNGDAAPVLAASAVRVERGGVDSEAIADGSITGKDLATGSVGMNQLQAGAVTVEKIADGSVGVAKREVVTVGSALGQLALSTATAAIDYGDVANPIDPSAIAWWRAENDTADALGTHHGTGSPGYIGGVEGQAFDFTGGQSIDCGNNPALQSNQGTWECWVNLPPGGSAVHRIAIGKSGAFGLGSEFDGTLYLYPFAGSVLDSGIAIDDGTWHHIAATITSGGSATLYLDGNPVKSGSYTMGSTQSNPLTVGAAHPNGQFQFPGFIDEPAVYSTPLSATQIRAIYDAGADGKSLPITGSSGAVPELSASLAITGNRPVLVGLRPASGTGSAWLAGLPNQGIGELLLKRDGSTVGRFSLGQYPNLLSPGSIRLLDDGVLGGGAQTVNYGVEVQTSTNASVGLSNLQLYVIEQ